MVNWPSNHVGIFLYPPYIIISNEMDIILSRCMVKECVENLHQYRHDWSGKYISLLYACYIFQNSVQFGRREGFWRIYDNSLVYNEKTHRWCIDYLLQNPKQAEHLYIQKIQFCYLEDTGMKCPDIRKLIWWRSSIIDNVASKWPGPKFNNSWWQINDKIC